MTRARRGAIASRTMAALSLVAVAVGGVLGGVAIDRLLLLPRVALSPDRVRPAGGGSGTGAPMGARRRFMVDRMTEELGLTPEQRMQLDSIVGRRLEAMRGVREQFRPQVQGMLDSARQDLDRILTPEQRARFRQMRQNRMPSR